MPRPATLVVAPALAVAIAVAAAPTSPSAQPAVSTAEYLVQPGDTCLGIATRTLGDRTAYAAIHRLNPGLGPLPHVLRPGQLLLLPHAGAAPDARLTGTSGDVRVQRPIESGWNAAPRGSELFRSWRVAAEGRSSAEVTFGATQRLHLREHTTVVIQGPAPGRARASQVTLERGSVRTRMVERSGGIVRVTTPSAVAAVGAGSALIRVDDDGTTTLANHDGKPVDLRGTRGGRVTVADGMGSRINPGSPPERPRPLPPAPAWVARGGGPTAFAALGGAGATIAISWTAVEPADGYRLEIDGPGGVVVLAAEVPQTVTSLELHGVPAGAYRARVATIAADRFEGPPGPTLDVTVVAVAFGTPGRAVADDATAADPDAPLPPAGTAAPPPPVVALGGTIGDAGLTCESAGHSAAPLILASTGPTRITCTTFEGLAVAPFLVEVTAVTAAHEGAPRVALIRGEHKRVVIALTSAVRLGDRWRVEPGPGLTCEGFDAGDSGVTITVAIAGDAPASSTLAVLDDVTGGRVAALEVIIEDAPTAPTAPTADRVAISPPRPPARHRRPHVTAGAFAGWTAFPTGVRDGLELGDAPVTAYQVDSGAGAGMRAAWWPARAVFIEVEAALWPTGFVAADEPAWITSGHVVGGVLLTRRQRLGARAVLGAGGYALLGDATYARADVDPDLTWGLTGTWRLTPDLALRLDGRHRVAPDRSAAGVTHVFEAAIGIEAVVTRTAWRR